MSNIPDVLQEELASLQAESTRLEGAITQAQTDLKIVREKVDHINGLLALYGVANSESHHTAIERSVSVQIDRNVEFRADTPVIQTPLNVSFGRQTKAARMRDHITKLLLLRGSVHRTEILKELTTAGLMGQEKSPLPSLAAFLSGNREVFEPDGRGNFMLRKKSNGDSPLASGHGETGAGGGPGLS